MFVFASKRVLKHGLALVTKGYAAQAGRNARLIQTGQNFTPDDVDRIREQAEKLRREQPETFKKIEQLGRDPELMAEVAELMQSIQAKGFVNVSADGSPSWSNILKMVGDKDVRSKLVSLTELMRAKGVDPAAFAGSQGASGDSSPQSGKGSMLDSLKTLLGGKGN
ncbi:hypothetical protein BJ742DRAFT_739830 [Cladochytrium replicatum]|nr:hypothetical protein BJ742DRAFT_739830 [Cladochytrium replicatum]